MSPTCDNLTFSCTDWNEYVFHIKLPTDTGSLSGFTELFINGELHSTLDLGWDAGVDVAVIKETWSWMIAFFPQLGAEDLPSGGNIWVDDLSIDDIWNSSVSRLDPPTSLRMLGTQ